MFGELCLF